MSTDNVEMSISSVNTRLIVVVSENSEAMNISSTTNSPIDGISAPMSISSVTSNSPLCSSPLVGDIVAAAGMIDNDKKRRNEERKELKKRNKESK